MEAEEDGRVILKLASFYWTGSGIKFHGFVCVKFLNIISWNKTLFSIFIFHDETLDWKRWTPLAILIMPFLFITSLAIWSLAVHSWFDYRRSWQDINPTCIAARENNTTGCRQWCYEVDLATSCWWSFRNWLSMTTKMPNSTAVIKWKNKTKTTQTDGLHLSNTRSVPWTPEVTTNLSSKLNDRIIHANSYTKIEANKQTKNRLVL